MKKLYTTLVTFCLLVTFTTLRGQSANHVWSGKVGGLGLVNGNSLVVDASGNSYITGSFDSTADFDPGPAVLNFSSAGGNDVFISKIDASGNLVWAKQIGAVGHDGGGTISLDGSGNIIITGGFSGTVDFDPGLSVSNLTSNVGGSSIFVLKLDAAGGFVWAKSIVGDYHTIGSVALDPTGSVYVTGSFGGVVDFDPGPINSSTSAGFLDVFVLKWDNGGNFQWVKAFGSFDLNDGQGITIDGSGNIIFSGTFNGTLDFDPGPAVVNLIANVNAFDNGFIAKLDATGSFIWAKQFSGTATPKALKTDASGNVYSTGYFFGVTDFDPGTSVSNLTSIGTGYDMFISKLDASGNFSWVKGIGDIHNEMGNAIATDASGNIYVGGVFGAGSDFDPGVNTFQLPVPIDDNAFILKLNPSGGFIWARNIANTDVSSANSGCRGLALDASGNIYSVGVFEGVTDFDASSNQFIMSAPKRSAFVQKISQGNCGIPNYSLINVTTCDSFNVGGFTHFTTGFSSNVLTGYMGCDSVVNLNLVINNSPNQTIPQVGCDSLTLNGQTYYASAVVADTFTNVLGCDSILVYNITIRQTTFSNLVQAVCDSFSFNNIYHTSTGVYYDTLINSVGCDSIITLNLTVNNNIGSSFSQSACDSFHWNGVTYVASGAYYDTLLSITGCDSVVTMNLTINTIDDSVTKNAAVLTAFVTGASYQWVYCDSNYAPIPGETNQSFTATHNGNYAVVVSQNGCIDTSDCKLVNHLVDNIDEVTVNKFEVYPNPTTGLLHVLSSYPMKNVAIRVRNIFGQVIIQGEQVNTKDAVIDLMNFPTGHYILEVVERGIVKTFRVVKI